VLEFVHVNSGEGGGGSGGGAGGSGGTKWVWSYRGPTGPDVFRYLSRIPDERPPRPEPTVPPPSGAKPPPPACWYCYDKLYIRFMDLLTYPRPPRYFTMLLCRDDHVRALKQVSAKGGGAA
jgi:hypothetical protein